MGFISSIDTVPTSEWLLIFILCLLVIPRILVTDTVEEVTEKIKAVERIPNEIEDTNSKTNIKIMKKKSRRAKVNREIYEKLNTIYFLEKIQYLCGSSESCYKVHHRGK